MHGIRLLGSHGWIFKLIRKVIFYVCLDYVV